MNTYVVCLSGVKEHRVSADDFYIDFKDKYIKFIDKKKGTNVAFFNFNNILGFWKEEN